MLQQSEQETDLLSSREFRWFWISWSNNVITCGKWDLAAGHDVLFSYRELSPLAVNFMSVGSAEFYSTYWLIPSQYYDPGSSVFLLCVKPNTHLRRRRDATVELSRVGGVYTEFA